jgi:hypothetical protein
VGVLTVHALVMRCSAAVIGRHVADPLFINPDNFDFHLKPGSPAFKLGFEQIDVSTVDPRGIVVRPASLSGNSRAAPT